MDRIANFVYDKARLIIAITLILSVVALASFSRFELDPDFMSFFYQGNPKSAEYNYLSEKYENGEPISILVEKDGSVLTRDSLMDVSRLQKQIGAVDGVSRVQSFLPSEVFVQGQAIPVDEQFIDEDYELLVDFIENTYYLTEETISSDRQMGIITASLSQDASVGEVIGALKALVEEEGDLELSLAGSEIIKDTLRHSIVTVLLYLPPFAFLLILLVFIAVIRSPRLSIMAMLPAGVAILWSYGTILWSGHKLDLVTSAAPLFILVLGTAYGLHYVSHFIDNLHKYSDRRQLTRETLRMVGVPISLATLTTMAGFAALMWTEVIPIRSLGLFATIGIGYAGLLALLSLPALLAVVKLPGTLPPVRESRLARAVLTASRQRVLIALFFLAVVGVSAFYIPKLEVVSDQLMWFKQGSETRRTYDKIVDHFGMAFPLTGEIASPAGLLALGDPEFANSVLAVERELEKLPSVGSAFSVFDLVKGINRMTTGQDAYPQDPMVLQGFMSQMGSEELGSWVSADGFRLIVKTQDLTSEDIDELESFVDTHDMIRVITGMPILYETMNTLVTQSQIRSLALAFALIFAILLVSLRRLGAALAGLVPIVITVVGILGFLALSGTNLHIVTAVLSAISIGVGVDYSIHVISAIYHFRNEGLDNRQAVSSALSVVSGPVVANALGITIGLCVMFLAPLKLYTDAAAVISLAMVLSAAGALLLIPLFYTWRDGKRPTSAGPVAASTAAETAAATSIEETGESG